MLLKYVRVQGKDPSAPRIAGKSSLLSTQADIGSRNLKVNKIISSKGNCVFSLTTYQEIGDSEERQTRRDHCV